MQGKTIGEKIREYRLKKGLTQDALAAELHISSQAISKWETGQTMPDINMLVPLSKVLGIGVNDLLGGDRRKEFEEKWHNASPYGEEFALSVAEDALEEFPDDKTFLYRRALHEYYIGKRQGISKARAHDYLHRANFHFAQLHSRFPESETYVSFLAEVNSALGETDIALNYAYNIKDCDRREMLIAEILGGDEKIRYKQKTLGRLTEKLYCKLISYDTRDSINAAHALLDAMMPQGKTLRNSYWSLFMHDACICLDEGDLDGYVEGLTKAYETVKVYDALPREPIGYPDPLFDHLKNNRNDWDRIYHFISALLSNEKYAHPASLELRRRVADENLTYHRLWKHEWLAFYQFCRNHICKDVFLNFSIGCDISKEEEQTERLNFVDIHKHKHGNVWQLEYYKHAVERLVGGGKMTGFAAYHGNEILGYCNCGNKTKYVCLPVSEEYRAVPEGAKVFSIVEIMLTRNFEDCGVEEKMLECALEWAKNEGYTLAEAYVVERKIFKEDAAKFEKALALYEKLGFTVIRILTENGQRKYIMQMEL